MKLTLNLNNWVKNKTQIPPQPVVTDFPIEDPKILFIDFFRSQEEYDLVMSILVDKKKCSASTFLWMDRQAGYKGALVTVIKYIHIQGYLKGNKELSVCEIRNICKNTFGISVHPSTIMHCKPEPLAYIPRSKSFQV